MEAVIKSNKILVLGIICILAAIGGTFLLINFFKKFDEAAREAKENKKLMEFYSLVFCFVAVVISIFSIFYSNSNDNRTEQVIKRIEELEQKIK